MDNVDVIHCVLENKESLLELHSAAQRTEHHFILPI